MSQFSGGQFGGRFPNNGGGYPTYPGPQRGRGFRGPRRPFGGQNGNSRFSGPRGGNSGYTNTGRGSSINYDDSDYYTGPMCVNPDFYTEEPSQDETNFSENPKLNEESSFDEQPSDMGGDSKQNENQTQSFSDNTATGGQFGNTDTGGQFGSEISDKNIDNYYEQYEAGPDATDVQSNQEKGGSLDSYTTSSYAHAETSQEDLSKTGSGVDQAQGDEKVEQEEAEEEEEEAEDSSDDDTDFCKYCKITFTSVKGFLAHTRGLQHTSLVMEAKALKGDKKFQKETVAPEVLEVHIPKPQEPTEEPEPDLVDVANWMELGDEVVDYIRFKRNVGDRDLHPDNIGKRQFDDNFSCPLCDIKCTGAASFKSHIEGKQHKNNMAMAEQGGQIKKKKVGQTVIQTLDNKERPPKFNILRDKTVDPLLGMEYITEFQKPDYKAAARYVCNMCESKCDASTIIPHIVGMKHRLSFFKIHRPAMYDHLTKYTSKKKKSEMNANCEDFAQELEKEVGRSEVKVKLELETENEGELEETMIRTSQALKEKIDELQNSASDASAAKKPRLGPPEPERYPPPPPPWGRGGRGHPHGYGRGWGDRDNWGPYMPDPYYGRPLPPGPPPPGLRHDMYADYHRRFDPHAHDPYLERRLHDERRYLDDLMLERHRLTDPLQEKRRLDDIVKRRTVLESLEDGRIDSFLERKKRLQEEDVDYQRLKRLDALKGRDRPAERAPEKPVAEKIVIDYQSPSSRPSMEELIARRRSNAELVSKLEERPKEREELLADRLSTEKSAPNVDMAAKQAEVVAEFEKEKAKNPDVNVTQLMDKLTSSMISSEEDASVALQLSSALTQALLKYRLHNAPKELSGVASALQSQLQPEPSVPEPSIPGLGTDSSSSYVPSFLKASPQQATPQQWATSQQQTTPHSLVSPLYGYAQQTYSDPSYDASSVAYTAPSVAYTAASVAYTAPSVAYTAPSVAYTAPSVTYAPTGVPAVTKTTSSTFSGFDFSSLYAIPSASNTAKSQTSVSQPTRSKSAVSGSARYDSYSQAASTSALSYSQINSAPTYSEMVTTATATVPSQPVPSAVASPKQTASNKIITTNVDQPQKLLLESIRKQTELIMKKISSSASSPRPEDKQYDGKVAQSQMRHSQNSTSQSPSTQKAPSKRK